MIWVIYSFIHFHIFKECVKKLIVRDAAQRLGNLRGGADEIKEQKWFKSLDFDKLLAKKIPAPWVPKIKNITDTSNFDPYATDEHVDDGSFSDNSGWDKDF